MTTKGLTRREFLVRLTQLTQLAAVMPLERFIRPLMGDDRPVVSIARLKRGDVARAVEEAIDLLGGIETASAGVDRIMLKPNLVNANRSDTTDPEVVRALARLMRDAGKQVSIGEGSAAAGGFNADASGTYRTHNPDILNPMQQHVFDTLGYTDLAEELDIPLVNLHTGEMATVEIPDAFVFDTLDLHHTLTEIDMLVSMPRMKTHTLAGVTLGMKNLIGLYCGQVYGTVRWLVHDLSSAVEPSGTAVCIVDMVRANKLGLTVIDGLVALEGNGPSLGSDSSLVNMDLIIAGANPLATDMVAASVMGFEMAEIPTFEWAIRAGLLPTRLDDIEVRGESVESVRRPFRKPSVLPWSSIRDSWGHDMD